MSHLNLAPAAVLRLADRFKPAEKVFIQAESSEALARFFRESEDALQSPETVPEISEKVS